MRNDFELEREQHAVTERDLRAKLASTSEQHEALQEAQAMMQKRVDALRAQNAALLDAYATAKRWSAEFARGARELADTLEQPVLDDAVGAQQPAPGKDAAPPASTAEERREAANRFSREDGDEGEEPKSGNPPPDWLS
jgi:peptidoglycan hydrolase CwlO-like protein